MALEIGRALKNPGQVYPFQASVELEAMEVLSDPVHFVDVNLEGEFFCTGDHRISLKAEVSATAVSRCSRCLEPVQVPVRAEIDALYAKTADPDDKGRAAAGASAAAILPAGLQGPLPRVRHEPEPFYLLMPGGQRYNRPLFGIERLCAK